MYKYYNPNPVAARVGDCTVRAISCATGKGWEDVYISLALYGFRMADMPSANAVWGAFLSSLGYKRQAVDSGCTVAQYAREHSKGTFVLALSGHVVAVIDGDWLDTWDCGGEEVFYIWSKEG